MNDDYPSSSGSGASWLDKLSKAFSSDPRNREDLKTILHSAAETGILDSESLTMLEGALSMSEMQVRDVMVPRSQMVVINHDADLDDFLPLIVESGHSRFPVIREDKDEVEGILLAKDLLHHFSNGRAAFDLSRVIRPASVIPESKRLNMLLRDFRAGRNHMAIVVDEYGGVSGLVTIEDVLEEIVGEIDDEHDVEDVANIVELPQGRFRVQALTPIEEFNELFECELSGEYFDTVGGLVLAEFGRLPEVGESIAILNYQFDVVAADKRRLHMLEASILG